MSTAPLFDVLMLPAMSLWYAAVADLSAPEVSEEWKRRLDDTIAAWSAAFERAMVTDAFAEVLSKTVERWLAQQASASTSTPPATEADVAALQQRLDELTERLDRLVTALADVDLTLTKR